MKHTWVELDLSVLAGNIKALQSRLRPHTEIIFLVKSDAYGHGLVPVAACARSHGVRWFAVAHLDEGLAVRQHVPDAEILLVGALCPDDVPLAIDRRITAILVSARHAGVLSGAAAASGRKLRTHAMVDTGMGRLGFLWSSAAETVPALADLPGLELCGLGSHFSSAGSANAEVTALQFGRFQAVAAACERRGLLRLFRHMANSGGIQMNPSWDLEGIRPGILLYGYGHLRDRLKAAATPPSTSPSLSVAVPPMELRDVTTRPFLQWRTRVLQVKPVPAGFPIGYDGTFVSRRETHIATLDVGYADGYSRMLSNKGQVIIRGRRHPVAGRVTMNFMMADVGPDTDVEEGDEAVLLGSQGPASIWAAEMAAWRDTIPHEVLTAIRTDDRRIIGS